MALIKCPECGKDVSDTIESCIHCGFVLKKVNENTDLSQNAPIEPANIPVQSSTSVSGDNNSVQPTTTVVYETNQTGFAKKAVIAAAVILLMIGLFKCCSFVSDLSAYEERQSSRLVSEQSEVSANYEKETTKIEKISQLDQVFSDYAANPVTAKEKYESDPPRFEIVIFGQVKNISESGIVIAYKTYRDGESYSLIDAKFNKDQLEFVKGLKNDDFVMVTGTFDSCIEDNPYIYSSAPVIYLKHCVFSTK